MRADEVVGCSCYGWFDYSIMRIYVLFVVFRSTIRNNIKYSKKRYSRTKGNNYINAIILLSNKHFWRVGRRGWIQRDAPSEDKCFSLSFLTNLRRAGAKDTPISPPLYRLPHGIFLPFDAMYHLSYNQGWVPHQETESRRYLEGGRGGEKKVGHWPVRGPKITSVLSSKFIVRKAIVRY